MNGRDIFRGLQYIGDDLIENAETGQFPAQNQGSGKTRRPIRRPLLAAALIALLLFAFSTSLGWSHYGTKAVEYLFGTAGSRIYKVVFVCMTVVGATMKLGLAWDLSDTFNGLMMIPNLIGVLVLSGTVVDITRNYFDRRVKGKDIEPMWSAFLEYQKQEEAEAAAEEAELEKAANE